MRRLRTVAACLYFLTHIWLYRHQHPLRALEWEPPDAAPLVRLGFVDSAGEVLWYGDE